MPRAKVAASNAQIAELLRRYSATLAVGGGNRFKTKAYGVAVADDPALPHSEEREVYRSLGLPFIEPELREDRGEIEAAQSNRLPNARRRRQRTRVGPVPPADIRNLTTAPSFRVFVTESVPVFSCRSLCNCDSVVIPTSSAELPERTDYRLRPSFLAIARRPSVALTLRAR